MTNFLIDNYFANLNPTSNALYYASLSEARKPIVITCSNKVPSRVIMMTPAPA